MLGYNIFDTAVKKEADRLHILEGNAQRIRNADYRALNQHSCHQVQLNRR